MSAAWPPGTGIQPSLSSSDALANSDTAPSSTEGVDFPIHVLAIAAMGIHLLDYLQFEDLRSACESRRRWEFLFVAAPLFILGSVVLGAVVFARLRTRRSPTASAQPLCSEP